MREGGSEAFSRPHYHPLLNDVILKALIPYIDTGDVPAFRKTCAKWHHIVGPRLRSEFMIDLSGNSKTVVSRKIARFIYAMPSSSIPFGSFRLSETKLGVTSLDRIFLSHLVPKMSHLRLITKCRSPQNFWTLMSSLEELEELELALSPDITASIGDMAQSRESSLRRLWRVTWMNTPSEGDGNEENEEGEVFSVDFLSRFYSLVQDSLQHLTLPSVEAWKHLQVLTLLGSPRQLNALQLSSLSQMELIALKQLSEDQGLQLSEFCCSYLTADVKAESLDKFLQVHSGTLKRLQVGWTAKDRLDVLEVSLGATSFPALQVLTLRAAAKMRYRNIHFGERFPNLRKLCVSGKEGGNAVESIHFWEDFLLMNGCGESSTMMHCVTTVRKLELIGVPLRNGAILLELMRIFPNVLSLTLGRPSRDALTTLWSLWPNLKELRIVSACPQIDEILTGIPTALCKRILIDRHFDPESEKDESLRPYLDGSIPSIRELKCLQRLEINGRLNCKLQSLSCLPSDVAVYYGFMRMPELRRVIVHRSLISMDASFHLQRHLPSWATVKVEQIKFEFDESIDAFQFHRNNQRLMKLLCGYPHNSLHMLQSFLTSLWMEGRLDL